MLKRRQGGMTLIEILLAIAVLVIGIVGLLPVFYAGLTKTGQTVTTSASAIITSSVIESVRQSMRLDTYTATERGSTDQANLVQYWHDGAATDIYFPLPHTGDKRGDAPHSSVGPSWEIEIPTSALTSGGGSHPLSGPVFKLGGSGALAIKTTDVDKDQIGTYSFNFKIRPTGEPHIDNVYEFVVRVYRNYDDALSASDGNRDNLVQEVHFIVAGN